MSRVYSALSALLTDHHICFLVEWGMSMSILVWRLSASCRSQGHMGHRGVHKVPATGNISGK